MECCDAQERLGEFLQSQLFELGGGEAGDDFPNMPPATGLGGFWLWGLQVWRADGAGMQAAFRVVREGSWLNSAPLHLSFII